MPELFSFLFSEEGVIRLGPSLISHSELRGNIEDDSKFYEVEWIEGHHPIIRTSEYTVMWRLYRKLLERFPTRDVLKQYIENIKTNEELVTVRSSYEYFINYNLNEQTKENIFSNLVNVFQKLAAFVLGNYNNKTRILEEIEDFGNKPDNFSQAYLGSLIAITEKFSDEEIISIIKTFMRKNTNLSIVQIVIVLLRHTLPKAYRQELISFYHKLNPVFMSKTLPRLLFSAFCPLANISKSGHPIEDITFALDSSEITFNNDLGIKNSCHVRWFPNCKPLISHNFEPTSEESTSIEFYDAAFEKIYAKFPTRDDLVKYYYEIKDFSKLAINPDNFYKLAFIKKYTSLTTEEIENYLKQTYGSNISYLLNAFAYLDGSIDFKNYILDIMAKNIIFNRYGVGDYAFYFVIYSMKFTEEDLKKLLRLSNSPRLRLDFIKSPIISDEFRQHLIMTTDTTDVIES